MAIVQVGWGDGTADKITLNLTGGVGNSPMVVTSPINSTANTRKKTVTLKTIGGLPLGTLTVSQSAKSRAYSIAYDPAYS